MGKKPTPSYSGLSNGHNAPTNNNKRQTNRPPRNPNDNPHASNDERMRNAINHGYGGGPKALKNSQSKDPEKQYQAANLNGGKSLTNFANKHPGWMKTHHPAAYAGMHGLAYQTSPFKKHGKFVKDPLRKDGDKSSGGGSHRVTHKGTPRLAGKFLAHGGKKGLPHKLKKAGEYSAIGGRVGLGFAILQGLRKLEQALIAILQFLANSAIGSVFSGLASAWAAVVHGIAAVAHAIGSVGTVALCVVTIGASAATISGAHNVLQPEDNEDDACSTEQVSSYTANFKVTDVGKLFGASNDVSVPLEKWCASQHLNAVQTAAVLGNCFKESTLGTAHNGGGQYGDFMGAGSTTADTSHNGDSVANYMKWFIHKFSGGYPNYGPAPAAWNQFKKKTANMSPYDAAFFWAAHLDVAGGDSASARANDYPIRGHAAEKIYKAIAGGSTSGVANGGDADSNSSNASDDASSACNQSSGSDTEDGTGSISEKVAPGGNHYKPDEVPSDMRKYIHSPKDVGMTYLQGGKGWPSPGTECFSFSVSYGQLIWGMRHYSNMPGDGGKQVAGDYKEETNGTMSSTPAAGDIASVDPEVIPLTAGNSYGHTFVVQHVLANGDFIIVEQNWPGKSGDDTGSPGPYTWDFAVLPKSLLEKYKSGFHFCKPGSKYHLRWSK